MKNKEITVITVTLNNIIGLNKTLESLLLCKTKPNQIIIIDGGSTDGTSDLVEKYKDTLPILFNSEKDCGIYDAMNKGLFIVKTPLVHYLNAGDIVVGDPYFNCESVSILPVLINDPKTGCEWNDFIKLSGYGYCHQGLIFPSSHEPFDTSLNIAADFDLISRTFPNGLNALTFNTNGYVVYELGGISSQLSLTGEAEIIFSARKNLSFFDYLQVLFFLKVKKFFPSLVRRTIAVCLFARNK